jgi:NADPH:quinone reductase-like Zn-dependent oxidoreductase
MKAWQLKTGSSSLDDMHLVDLSVPDPAPGAVRIRVQACSLNYRDQAIVTGNYFGGKVSAPQIPLSCGAGVIDALGEGVTQYKIGDRVAGTFFQGWESGVPNRSAMAALGAPPAPGMLSEFVCLPAFGVVPMAATLSFEEAATLPCAGVTAWNALMEGANPTGPGQTVLILGTGGVSLLGLQIAKAAGATVAITSSSDAKLERAKALGADALINYRTHPEWHEQVHALVGGADHVVEVGGVGTLSRSMRSLRFGGEIGLIGVLTREGDTNPHGLMLTGSSLRGIFVGSAAMARALNRAVDATGIKPMVDKVFAMDEARDAYRYQASPELFGKVVIRLG